MSPARPATSGRRRAAAASPFALERLYEDQHHDHVVDAVPAVLAWVPDRATSAGPFEFELSRGRVAKRSTGRIALSWDIGALRQHDATVEERALRMRRGRTPQREHVTELAAYGLALVAISLCLPGRRVEGWNKGYFPDILFDATPGALRGVEVAGRTTGGRGEIERVLRGTRTDPGKVEDLRDADNVVEGYVSVWCRHPAVAVMLKVKP